MDRTKKSPVRADQPRPSEALSVLREKLALNDDEWRVFLRYAREGFADCDKASHFEPDIALRLEDVPDQWWEEPQPLGFVFLRVIRRGTAELAAKFAWYFLQMYDAELDFYLIPPGTGLAWLHLSRAGVAPPEEPAAEAPAAEGTAEPATVAAGEEHPPVA